MRWVTAREFGPARLVDTVLIGSLDPAARAQSMRDTRTSKAAPMCSGTNLSARSWSWTHAWKVAITPPALRRRRPGARRRLPSYRAAVSYTHLRAHETVLDLVCRLLLEKKKKNKNPQDRMKKTKKK